MADISNFIEYERTYPVDIVNPSTGEGMGITVNVVSSDSKRVVSALQKAKSDYWAKMASKDDGTDDVEVPDSERIVLINAIDSWDWGDSQFCHISGSGSPSFEDRVFFVDHKNSKWIRDQLNSKIYRIENFMQPSQKSVRRGSKKT